MLIDEPGFNRGSSQGTRRSSRTSKNRGLRRQSGHGRHVAARATARARGACLSFSFVPHEEITPPACTTEIIVHVRSVIKCEALQALIICPEYHKTIINISSGPQECACTASNAMPNVRVRTRASFFFCAHDLSLLLHCQSCG